MHHNVWTYTRESQVNGHLLHLGPTSEANAIETVQQLVNYIGGPGGRDDNRIGIVIKRGDEVVWHWERGHGILGLIHLTLPSPKFPDSLIVRPRWRVIAAYVNPKRRETTNHDTEKLAVLAVTRIFSGQYSGLQSIVIHDPQYRLVYHWDHENFCTVCELQSRVPDIPTPTRKVFYMGQFTTEKPQPRTRIYVEMQGGAPAIKATNDEEYCNEQTIGFIGADGALHLKQMSEKQATALRLLMDGDRYIQVVRSKG